MDNTITNEDRGDINEATSPRAKLVTRIGSTVILVLGLGIAYVVLDETEKKQDTEVTEKRKLTESVPTYTLPEPKKSGAAKTADEPETPPDTLTMAELEEKIAAQQKLFEERLAEERRLAEQRLADANRHNDYPSQSGSGNGSPPEETEEEKYQARLLQPNLGGSKSGAGSGANLRSSPVGDSNIQGEGNSYQPVPYQNIDLSVTKTNIVQASRLPNLSYLIPKGVPIPCALNMAIQSDQSGLLTCVTTEDIYSSDGTVILVDRGSNVTGEYRSASISLGKNRIFAIWDRIRTPSGVVVQIDSPAVGALGRAGIGGYVDNHYLQRFGSAVLVSLIDDAFAQKSSAKLDNTSDTVNDIAGQILSDNLRIKPTLHKAQGGEVMIIVANDLDFSTVYGLHYE